VLLFDITNLSSQSGGFNLFRIRAVFSYNCLCLCNRSISDFLSIDISLKRSVLPNVWQIHSVQLCIHQFMYTLITHNPSAVIFGVIHCDIIKSIFFNLHIYQKLD
jgi:hypothetical protein